MTPRRLQRFLYWLAVALTAPASALGAAPDWRTGARGTIRQVKS